MNKFFQMLLLLVLLVLTACASNPAYETSLVVPDQVAADQEVPLTLTVKENHQPVTGLTIAAHLEMKKMDHGSIDVTFTEKGNGEYVAPVKIPMGGEWVAVTQINGSEQEIDFTVKGAE